MPKINVVIEEYNNMIDVYADGEKLKVTRLSLDSKATFCKVYPSDKEAMIHITNRNIPKHFIFTFWLSFLTGVCEYTLKDLESFSAGNDLIYKLKIEEDVDFNLKNTRNGIVVDSCNVEYEIVAEKRRKKKSKMLKYCVIIPIFFLIGILLFLSLGLFIWALILRSVFYSLIFGGVFFVLLLIFAYGIRKTYHDRR